MAERSFKVEVESLRLGEGEVFSGEGILAVTKALLQSGVAYIGGYQGAPISHLMDVFSDAHELLQELGIHFQSSANEAAAAAMLAASVNYPLRGAVAWKSVVGTNVASDALSNIASGGVKGGALVIVGEDYGEGSSIMQERTHAFAMKSQIWLLDPRPNLTSIVSAVEHGFSLSEASNTPVLLQLRVRACHVYGQFIAKANVPPKPSIYEVLERPARDLSRIVLPPSSILHEIEKVEMRWPAATRYIEEQRINEYFGPAEGEFGIIVQGGLFNSLNRALEILHLSDEYGNCGVPIYVLNATYPLVRDEVVAFCKGKREVLVVEEGQPEFIEHELNAIIANSNCSTKIVGKSLLPRAGEYTGKVLIDGLVKFLQRQGLDPKVPQLKVDRELLREVPERPPGLCTGCPERPIFTAIKLAQREVGPFHISSDIGCHLFSILPPFNLGNTTMGYGLSAAGASAFRGKNDSNKALAVMGDGGFWHNGLTSGIGSAVFNQDDSVTVIVDNSYSAATGGQDILSSKAGNPLRSTRHSIEKAVRGVGVRWVRLLSDTYKISRMRDTLLSATREPKAGPKVIIAQSECMLNKQRRERPLMTAAIKQGKRVVRDRFGVDANMCTGDHSCIRISGCPSLSVRENPDPLREDPIAYVDNTCVGCGVCGEASHAAVLCPSFYKVRLVSNPNVWESILHAIRSKVIGRLQEGIERRVGQRSY